MCQTYRGKIEGGLESVPRLYKSLIERKKGPGLKENWQKKQNVHKRRPGEPDLDIEDLFYTVFQACFSHDNAGTGNPHKKNFLKDFYFRKSLFFPGVFHFSNMYNKTLHL